MALLILSSFTLNSCAAGANIRADATLLSVKHESASPQPTPAFTRSPTKTFSLTPWASPTWPPPSPNATATRQPSATASPTPLTCWLQGGRIEIGSLDTDLLRLPLEYRIYLPPCYDQQPERRYPILYLIHGQSYKDDQWDRLGADETADALISTGQIPPFIIIMPYDRYGGEPGESQFAQAILEVLMPHLDQTYRTLPGREHRAVGGLSRGAGWAVHLAIAHWETFGALGAHSPAIFYYDAERMRKMLDSMPADSYPRIYVDIGDKDRPEIMRVTLWFEDVLNQKSIPHEWHLFNGYHSEEYWSAHMQQYLRWYTRAW
ncbi:MAG: hypothetical protein JXA78_03685 [Anaerolineales bacterium]|nr:hypothetical protein [Anaerolineales bacterium]